jgi:hypothetical protein
MYAREDGKLHIVQSAGWEVEEIVTKQAVDDLLRLTEDARQRVLAGQTSPLEYHMYRVRMDVRCSRKPAASGNGVSAGISARISSPVCRMGCFAATPTPWA